MRQLAECEFADHAGVGEHLPVLQAAAKLWVADPQVVDPNRGVDKDHRGVVCRLGTASSVGSLPASCDSRRALSRSISARRAWRTNALFSVVPVRRCASRTRSSSKAIVVLISTSRHVFQHRMMILHVPRPHGRYALRPATAHDKPPSPARSNRPCWSTCRGDVGAASPRLARLPADDEGLDVVPAIAVGGARDALLELSEEVGEETGSACLALAR